MRTLRTSLLFLLFLIAGISIHAKELQADFEKANDLYKKGDYESAIKAYEDLIKVSDPSVEVYYNLGNSYYKTGNTAKSILNYERALLLSPDDEDINFNLRIAQLKVADRIEPLPEIFYKRWIRSIVASMPLQTWSMIFIICFWMLFASASWYLLSLTSLSERISFACIIVFMILSVCTFAFARDRNIQEKYNKSAIITSASVYVKSSPDDKGNDLFILHEGTKVNVLDELGDWKKIRISNGTVGWLKSNEIEHI